MKNLWTQELVSESRQAGPQTTFERPQDMGAVALSARDEDLIIASLIAISPSIAAIAGGDCEVVVHDLRIPERSIVALVNGHVSGRKLGGPLIGGPINDIALTALSRRKSPDPRVLSYDTKTNDGRSLKSSTTLFYKANGAPFAGICLNHDLSTPFAAVRWLNQLIGGVTLAVPGDDGHATSTDFSSVLDNLIDECVKREPGRPTSLDRDARIRIVRELESRGAFLMRGSVVKVAVALAVSKFTIYGYLDEVRAS